MIQIKSRGSAAIRQLKLNVNPDSPQDQNQLTQILISILDYPDLRQASKHQNANKLGNQDLIQEQKKLQLMLRNKTIQEIGVCDCCGMIVNKQQIAYCIDLRQIKIGIGSQLYFKNLLFSMLIMALLFTIFSIYSIITNQNSCASATIMQCGIDGISLSSKIIDSSTYEQQLMTGSYLAIAIVIVWGFVQLYKNHFERQLIIKIQQQQIKCSDFTLMLQNFPSIYLKDNSKQTLAQIQNIFHRYQKSVQSIFSYQITKVNVAYNLYSKKLEKTQQNQHLNMLLQKRQNKFKEWIAYRKTNINFPVSHDSRQRLYDQYQQFYFDKYIKQFQYESNFNQKNTIFVTLRSSSARQQIQNDCRPASLLNIFNIFHTSRFPLQKVKVSKALPPEQIIWQNFGFDLCSKFFRILIVYGVAVIFLAVSLGITVGLNYLQIDQQQYFISALLSLGITIINIALQILIMNLSTILNQKTKSAHQFNIAFKICLFELLNVIGVPLLAIYISKKQLYGSKGLSSDIFFIGLFNIIPPLGRFIDPWNLYIKFRRFKLYRPKQFITQLDTRLWNFNGQQQFNKTFEDNQFQLGYQYAYLIKTVLFTAFFVSLQPIIAFFAFCGLGLIFFINKYRILYRFGKPKFNSSVVNSLVNILLHLGPIFLGLGLLVFTNWQTNYKISSTQYLNYITLIIGSLFFFLPFRILYKCFQQHKFQNWDYDQKKPFLPSQYDRANPVTKQISISSHQDYLRQLQAKQKLPMMSKLVSGNSLRVSLRDTLRNSKLGVSRKKTDHKIHLEEGPKYNENISSYEMLFK